LAFDINEIDVPISVNIRGFTAIDIVGYQGRIQTEGFFE
jgi:hypothetical protein